MAKTGHPNFDYTCQGYWRGVLHKFSITGNHSGTSFGSTDAQTFMEGESSPYYLCFRHFQSTGITVVGTKYYDGQNSAPVFEANYDTDHPVPAPLTAVGDAYGGTDNGDYLPLEVCCDLYAVCGTSRTSKPIYLRKYLRGVPTVALQVGTGGESVWDINSTGVTAAKTLGNGSLYGSRVYISPSARSATGVWAASSFPGNHQVPRGRKRKTTSTSSSLFNDALALAKAAAEGATGAAGALAAGL